MRMLPLSWSDPYIVAWARYVEVAGDGCEMGGAAWHFEAIRRMWCLQFRMPYSVAYQTWGWTHHMVTELARVPFVGIEKCEPDPSGPGDGFHVFGWPSDEELLKKSCPNWMWQLPPEKGDSGRSWDICGLAISRGVAQLAVVYRGGKWKVANIQNLSYWTKQHVVVAQALLKSPALNGAVGEKLPRADRRRAKREGRRLTERDVRIVKWRKAPPQGGDDTGCAVERDKHWWVQGHLRNQWYPAAQVHRAIYIAPHPKGNLDAPLYHRPTVNAVVR